MEDQAMDTKAEVSLPERNRNGMFVIGAVGATCCVGAVAVGSLALPATAVAATGVSVGILTKRFLDMRKSKNSTNSDPKE